MKRTFALIAVASLSLIVCGMAEAQTRGRADLKRPSFRAPSVSHGQSSRPSRISNHNTSNRSRSLEAPRADRSGRDRRGSDRSSNSGLNDDWANGLAGLLNQHYGNRNGYDPYAGGKAYAKAYRDAAIANAVVGLVGVLVSASQQRQQYAVSAPAAPAGQIVKERRLVQDARMEEYQVWVPEYRIPQTNEIVPGHHETRRKEVPAVYEEREVWVPTQ
ncbi:MAG: hypothetical protein HYV27_11980 [Candidatus Hydrogenedentes bacterium]|nr:hypothetical protein [Candidatus Hydrogenedentota bacterium]